MKSSGKQSGFTLVEVLLSTAIVGMLLASVAAAFHASLLSYDENEEIAAVTQSARWALNRIVGDVRTAAALEATSSRITIIPPGDSGLDEIEYEYVDDVLYYRRTTGGQTASQTLLGDGDITLDVFAVQSTTGQDWQGLTCTKSVTIRMQFTADNQTFTMTVSAAPRRNQTY